jgi:hypothetical protein
VTKSPSTSSFEYVVGLRQRRRTVDVRTVLFQLKIRQTRYPPVLVIGSLRNRLDRPLVRLPQVFIDVAQERRVLGQLPELLVQLAANRKSQTPPDRRATYSYSSKIQFHLFFQFWLVFSSEAM